MSSFFCNWGIVSLHTLWEHLWVSLIVWVGLGFLPRSIPSGSYNSFASFSIEFLEPWGEGFGGDLSFKTEFFKVFCKHRTYLPGQGYMNGLKEPNQEPQQDWVCENFIENNETSYIINRNRIYLLMSVSMQLQFTAYNSFGTHDMVHQINV